jgi:hypothetical protein
VTSAAFDRLPRRRRPWSPPVLQAFRATALSWSQGLTNKFSSLSSRFIPAAVMRRIVASIKM